MKSLFLPIVLVFLTALWGAEDRKNYVAKKTKKTLKKKFKKKYRGYIPPRVNIRTDAERLKINEILRDMYE